MGITGEWVVAATTEANNGQTHSISDALNLKMLEVLEDKDPLIEPMAYNEGG
jgi:hypothetical protein